MSFQSKKPSGRAKDRILDSALELFNRSGTAAVSTNHIAEAAGLSIGNLYYHFKNKEEVIRALFDRYDAQMGTELFVPEGMEGLEALNHLLRTNQQILWRSRFFLREIGVLLQRDPILAESYRRLRRRAEQGTEALIHTFIDAKVLRAIEDPSEVRLLANAIIFVSEYYLSFVESGDATVEEEHLNEAVRLMQLVLTPYRIGRESAQ